MEIPNPSRALINTVYNGVEITIPPKDYSFVVIFLALAFAGFLAIEFIDPKQVFHSAESGQPNMQMIFRTTALAFGVFAAGALSWWYLSGEEIITFSDGELTIRKKRTLGKAKTYNLNEASNFRIVAKTARYIRNLQHGYRGGMALPWKTGVIHFDYRAKTIRFGSELDQAEAEYIVEYLRNKKLIS